MLKLNTKQQNLLTVLAIIVIGIVIVFVPTILKNERVLNFTTDTFNLVLLVVVGFILGMINVRIGIVYAVLILSILSYSQLNGFMAPLSLTEEEKYDNQFVLPLEQVKSALDDDNNYVNKQGIETFTSNKNAKTESFTDVQTTEPATPTDLTTYYNNLERESLTNKLKTTNFNFDAVSCRYDGVQQHQNVTVYGPPLGWNATYTQNVNGQLFYPLNG